MYVLWQIPGNIWLWSCHDCFSAAPVLSSVVFSYLLCAYIILSVPVLTFLASCVCAPCLLLVAISLLNSSFLAKSEGIIANLHVTTGNSGEKCAICVKEMGIEDRVINVGCASSHTFHENCIKRWLRLKMSCPICRSALLRPVTSS